jgi:aspartate carbamoyltransferase catalytic subunit
MIYKRKDFLGLKCLEAEEIHYILNSAQQMKYILSQKNKKFPHLKGKSAVMLFYEESSRSRLSFELAAQYLSANTVDMTVPKHLTRGESL